MCSEKFMQKRNKALTWIACGVALILSQWTVDHSIAPMAGLNAVGLVTCALIGCTD